MCYDRIHHGAGRPILRCRAQEIRAIFTASGGGENDTRTAAVCTVVSAAALKAGYLYTTCGTFTQHLFQQRQKPETPPWPLKIKAQRNTHTQKITRNGAVRKEHA